MRNNIIFIISVFLLSIYVDQLVFGSKIPEQNESTKAESIKLDTKLPQIFDFQHFKRIFNKSYDTLAEELAREKIFLSKAFQVFLSFFQYKHSKRSYFLKINHMSDWTNKEVDNLFPKETLLETFKKTNQLNSFSIPTATSEHIDRLASLRETKAIKMVGKHVQREPEDPVSFGLESNLPQSEPVDIAGAFGSSGVKYLESFVRNLWNKLFNSDSNDVNKEILKEKQSIPDVVYVDHRNSGCLSRVKNQSKCGACYIFSTFALYEYEYCLESGLKLEFSEQYPLDCGERAELRGCHGGNEMLVAGFNAEYGFELNEKYPYKAKSYTCPYSEGTNPRFMGYLKLGDYENGGLSLVPYHLISKVLPMVPVALGVGVPDDFSSYGGGIYDGHNCRTKNSWHSMVIIGQGIEDGQEYWLMRNSYGTLFGFEGGHFKMSVKAKIECFADQGLSYALLPREDGRSLFNLEGNKFYDRSYVRQRFDDIKRGKMIPLNPYTSGKGDNNLNVVTPASR